MKPLCMCIGWRLNMLMFLLYGFITCCNPRFYFLLYIAVILL
jgi:membrane protein YqaA with SNARE-associated domain